MIYFEVASSLQEEHFPCSHVLVAVGTPQCDDLDWEERLCRELATLTQTHTRASCCCYDVAVLLRLVVVKQQLLVLLLPSLVLSSLVTKNEKTKEKNDKKEKDDTSFCGYKKENQNRTAVTHSRTLLEKRESTTKGRGGKQKKNVTKSKESEELREGSFPQQLIFSSAITSWQLRAEKGWDVGRYAEHVLRSGRDLNKFICTTVYT